jgi:hypothetical protein
MLFNLLAARVLIHPVPQSRLFERLWGLKNLSCCAFCVMVSLCSLRFHPMEEAQAALLQMVMGMMTTSKIILTECQPERAGIFFACAPLPQIRHEYAA